MQNKYTQELQAEKSIFKRGKSYPSKTNNTNNGLDDDIPYMDSVDNKSSNYFSLLLDPSYADLEMKIRGLKRITVKDKFGTKNVLRRIPNHYLSDEGAEDILSELISYLGSDIKLGVLTTEEFLSTMDILRKFTVSYISNNMYKLGMDTEEKQRKAPQLINMILIRIRQVLSRSIAGKENERSHGDIKLSGELDFQKEGRFNMEDMKN